MALLDNDKLTLGCIDLLTVLVFVGDLVTVIVGVNDALGGWLLAGVGVLVLVAVIAGVAEGEADNPGVDTGVSDTKIGVKKLFNGVLDGNGGLVFVGVCVTAGVLDGNGVGVLVPVLVGPGVFDTDLDGVGVLDGHILIV